MEARWPGIKCPKFEKTWLVKLKCMADALFSISNPPSAKIKFGYLLGILQITASGLEPRRVAYLSGDLATKLCHVVPWHESSLLA